MAMRRFKYQMHHQWVTAGLIGSILPVFCQEVTPGESWGGRSSGIVRLDPLDRPAFSTLKVHVHFFFVPHRLTDSTFEEGITGKTAWSVPTINVSDTTWTDRLFPYFGIGQPASASNFDVNAFPIYAYNLCWNEFFRDQERDTAIALTNEFLKYPHYPQSDYLAGTRDEIQQGSEETVDSSGATIGVTEIRDAFHRQKFRERRSQFGERYTDYLRAMGVNPPDSRLDRPEHVARGIATLGLSEVTATATSASENTGAFRGHGITGISVKFPKRIFVEHGTLIGLMFVRGRNQLRKRVDRHWLLSDKDDYFQQELARDTQVAVDGKEWWSESAISTAAYQRRDEWLRTARDTCAGMMQYSAQSTWHSFIALSTDPSGAEKSKVSSLKSIFQDQTASSPSFYSFFDHKIGKRSPIPRARALA